MSKSNAVISFSHVHLYAHHLLPLEEYKTLENQLNQFSHNLDPSQPLNIETHRPLWETITSTTTPPSYTPHNRDVVKQLLVSFGFRITASRSSKTQITNTKSVLITSRDPDGVQFVITALDDTRSDVNRDECEWFDASNVKHFFRQHDGRQGIAVLGFRCNDVRSIYDRYRSKHPKLIAKFHQTDDDDCQILEVYAYYKHQIRTSDADTGTLLRFVQHATPLLLPLPGLTPHPAEFDSTSQPAYFDHWVSNVVSRMGFLETLEDTLGFTPKVDFNAGVVAAGEARIESTVTGNTIEFETLVEEEALKNRSQVYLPINNALSKVGHVHGFLKEIGQGVQHIASRVGDIIAFVQRGNDYREITGEGFSFLNIPRSYYGILSIQHLRNHNLTRDCALIITEACEKTHIVSSEGAVHLHLNPNDIRSKLDKCPLTSNHPDYLTKKDIILKAILSSRYCNMYDLLGERLTNEEYLGIVTNRILVDVQGDDLLFQIFTSSILQRRVGDEAPFLEFIQRVCNAASSSDKSSDEQQNSSRLLKPGCGGFGIRNFLTLFLSIEVSKAMHTLSTVKSTSPQNYTDISYYTQMVRLFTNQLNESNPILTEISDAMILEGYARNELERDDGKEEVWKKRIEEAMMKKRLGNEKLMKCSEAYKEKMRRLREEREMLCHEG